MRLRLSVALLLAATACNNSVPLPLGTDAAAPRPDAAPRLDAAAATDASGPQADAGEAAADAGAIDDAGVIVVEDAGTVDDTGPVVIDDGGVVIGDDAGGVKVDDAGPVVTPTDGGVLVADAGPGPTDGGLPPTDGGLPPTAYTETVLVAPTWVDACAAGLTLTLTDDDDGHSAASPLPFAFSFFGAPRATLSVSTNGYVTFDATPRDGFKPVIPDAMEGAAAYAYWQDLALLSNDAAICVATVGTAPDRRVVVQWSDVQSLEADDITHLTFELVLHEGSGVIDFVYLTMTPEDVLDTEFVNGTHAGIGLQSAAGAQSVRHMGTINTITGLRFTP